MKFEKKEIAEFTPLPKNIYQVELLNVNAEQRPTYDTRLLEDDKKIFETVLNFQLVLLAGKDKEENLRGRSTWINFVPTSLYISKKNGKNMLYKVVEALIGRDLTNEEEAYGLTSEKINSLVGRQCRVVVDVETKNGKTFNKVKDCVAKEVDYPKLTDEEKEKATVKKEKTNDFDTSNAVASTDRGEQYLGQDYPPMPDEETISVASIPF